MYSRVVIWTLLLEFAARWIHELMGFIAGYDRIRMKVWRILFRKRRCVGGSDDSISSAEVAVVWKVPNMAFIAVLCAVSSLLSDAGRWVFSCATGRCHIMAA